jgi:hypothetical protein
VSNYRYRLLRMYFGEAKNGADHPCLHFDRDLAAGGTRPRTELIKSAKSLILPQLLEGLARPFPNVEFAQVLFDLYIESLAFRYRLCGLETTLEGT